MKNKILIILLMSISTIGFSQSWGVKGGINVSNLTTKDGDIDDTNARFGYTIGLFKSYEVKGIFSLQPEILFSTKGSNYSGIGYDVDAKLSYVDIPVLFTLNFLDPFYIYAGPQLSFLIDSKLKYTFLNGVASYVDTDESNNRRLDFGGAIGLGLNFGNTFLDARLSKGYINYDKDRTVEGAFVEAKNLKNINFQLTTGLKF